MKKPKRKRTSAEKAAKKRRQKEYMTIFVNGKQKSVKRPPTIDGMDVEEFILRNADPIWLHQNEMWEYISDNAYNNFNEYHEYNEDDEDIEYSENDEDIPF
jgi:hypothetical protein